MVVISLTQAGFVTWTSRRSRTTSPSCQLRCREVTRALSRFSEVFAHIPPYRQKELVRLVVHRVELTQDSMKMALYGRVAAIGPVSEEEGASRSGISEWLPILDDVRYL